MVISLGHRCQTAQHLRRMMIHSGTMPFDWIISSVSGVADAIESDFDGILWPERLELREDRVIDHRFGFAYVHEFPIGADYLLAHVRVRRRQELLIGRFRKAMGSAARILFVRHEAPGIDVRGAAERLVNAVAHRRPRTSFHLLFLSEAGPPIDERIAENISSVHTEFDFADVADRWDAVFNSIHEDTPIRAYYPGLVRAVEKTPPNLQVPIQKIVGTSRRRLMRWRK
jgi:hypothetical protein